MGTVIDMQNDVRVKQMIPGRRTTTAAGVTTSAATYGSGGHTSLGIFDMQDCEHVEVWMLKQTGTAQKASVRLYEQSAATTLIASATAMTSGMISAITTSSYIARFVIRNHPQRKRYLNAIVVTSTTSGNVSVVAFGRRNKQSPPSTTGIALTREVAA